MDNLHYIQMSILKSMLFKPKAVFSDFEYSKTDSEVLAYHLKSLIGMDFLQKDSQGYYLLTQKGKQFAADIDIDTTLISSRAKLSIIVTALDESGDETKYLFIKRLKAPLLNHACFIAGKVKYGEAASLTAKRELFEESGLIAKEIEYRCFHRQFVYDTKGEFLKDNAFCMFIVKSFEGEVKPTLEAEPFWATEKELKNLEMKAYDLDDLFSILKNPPADRFLEKDFITKSF